MGALPSGIPNNLITPNSPRLSHPERVKHGDWRQGLMVLPKKPAREGLQGRIESHQREHGQLSLGGQQVIKRATVGDGVAPRMQALLQHDRQQLKVLSDEQLGQVVEQIADARQFADAHLGGDLPAGSGAHIHRIGGVIDAGMGGWREAVRPGQAD